MPPELEYEYRSAEYEYEEVATRTVRISRRARDD
jgi:hypothetical protein